MPTSASTLGFKLIPIALLATILTLHGCGGGDGSPTPSVGAGSGTTGGSGTGGSSGSTGGSAQTYALSGTISGLTISGLVLAVNGTDVSVAANASTEQFATGLAPGAAYSITVDAQPDGEVCSVASGSGTIGTANVGNVVVSCSAQAYAVGGTVSGLNNSGLVLANGSDTVTVNSGATTFALPTSVAYGSTYNVTVQTQPPGLACAVANGGGTMPANAVTNVAVNCTDQPFALGGTISGLGNNTGLVLANGSDSLTVPAGATNFTMPAAVAYSVAYNVTVQSAPSGLRCTVSNGSGTMPSTNITTVGVTCSDQSYSLGGTIAGLGNDTGLVLANGSDTVVVPAGATSFTLPTAVPYGSPYSVTVQTQPTGAICSVASGSGVMPSASVMNVAVTCSVNTYTIGGSISGLSATGLVLLDNGADATTIAANATQFTMNTGVAYGSGYAITVQTQPSGETCNVTNGTGNDVAGTIDSVVVTCAYATSSLLYSFGRGGDGELPYAALIEGSDGNFYGTTIIGGATNNGTFFKVTPAGVETVLYSFAAGFDGANPSAALIQAGDGNFYGTTNTGGSANDGTVFKMTPAGVEQQLHSFGSYVNDGLYPYSGLAEGSDGTLYTATYMGGSSNSGAICGFGLTGGLGIDLSFSGGVGVASPYAAALIQGSDGKFYGTSFAGGESGNGTVFMFDPTGTGAVIVLHSFAGVGGGSADDGAKPAAALIQGSDGNFYGTTTAGGAGNAGTVFKITPAGVETVLHAFMGAPVDGAFPGAALIQGADGNFYGTTENGGAAGAGTVYKITPAGVETVLHSFAGSPSDGAHPVAPLIQGTDGNFYGTTENGGAQSVGAVFKIVLP